MYKLCFFVPVEYAGKVKKAIFSTGAGRIGNYDSCCFETEGIGQFRPLEGSNPAIGKQNQTEYVKERKVELICEDADIKEAIGALIESHPYEEPAYEAWPIVDFGVFSKSGKLP